MTRATRRFIRHYGHSFKVKHARVSTASPRRFSTRMTIGVAQRDSRVDRARDRARSRDAFANASRSARAKSARARAANARTASIRFERSTRRVFDFETRRRAG
jgi:hypothetical protein